MAPSSQRLLLLLLLPAAACAVLFATFFLGGFSSSSSSSWAQPSIDLVRSLRGRDLRFHLVLPATAVNVNLCRLLLSGLVTGYPEPVFVGWGGHGQYDGAKSHLFKISETLAYLNSLPASADGDLVLLLDAYDIWLQLRPDVLIKRYYDLIDRANQRLREDGVYGATHGGAEVRQSIVFGPDKTCWPTDARRAACWAVPKSSMSEIAFGPDTDSWMVPNRPIWLNSGTIMGPAKDMRDMFNGTMEQVKRKFDVNFKQRNSDQYYFQELFADQEVGRIKLRNGSVQAPVVGQDRSTGEAIHGDVPDLPPGRRTEYHVTLDYETEIFQTSAAYTEYLTWMSFNHSSAFDPQLASRRRLDQGEIPQDISNSPAPFASIEKADTDLPVHHSWADLILGVNGVTGTIFPLFHLTGEKAYRDRWWPRMWFHSHGRDLLNAARKANPYAEDPEMVAVVNGVRWKTPTVYRVNGSAVSGKGQVSRGGGWSDQGEHFGWDELCHVHEEKLFEM